MSTSFVVAATNSQSETEQRVGGVEGGGGEARLWLFSWPAVAFRLDQKVALLSHRPPTVETFPSLLLFLHLLLGHLRGLLNTSLSPSLFISLSLSLSEIVDHIERLQVLREIVKKFPPVNYQVFKYVITHLNR